MDWRLKIKMICLVVIAFLAGAREFFPETLPWFMQALLAGLIAAAAALNGFLDQGVAAQTLRNKGEEPTPGEVLEEPLGREREMAD